ncbi:hypothetical protein PTSG_03687 [Salpingoeca rosetta]|uniref:Uncharacterized protein n=1 Tax=Salpingoeca rosetta (strain ATCC 50818 / BSB-021) TaxID=946362 RepID=F2U6A8_SALR5|nr:uncharacterized protein PTSG_03687 [Salpingoeca rosetta]EGD83049.1 hypothetical protein PTSG_03687 [Salpingoeca rosetta]|eukprot:XP_004995413.1 hypothetical protein PTSG_03687 [Salpingoeca rosetta]
MTTPITTAEMMEEMGSMVHEDPPAMDLQDHPLHMHVRLKNKTKVTELLDAGADPNACAEGNVTPLMCAIVENSQDLVQLLVSRGADLNFQDEDGLSPCHWAVTHQYHSLLKQLLKLGANCGLPDKDGRSPVHWATTVESTKCLQLLCKNLARTAPAELDAKDINDMTPLLWAVTQSKPRHVNVLLKYDIDIQGRDRFGRSAVLCAAELEDSTCIQLLLETTTEHLEDTDDQGRTPLIISVANQRVKSVKQLLFSGANVNAQDESGHTALHWACALGDTKLSTMLLNAGADPHVTDSQGLNCLHYSMQGEAGIVALLAKEMTSLDDVTRDGQNAFMLGAIAGSLPLLRALLATGKQIGLNAADNDGRTALHLAFMSEAKEAAQLILSLPSIDVNTQDNDGKVPAFYCLESGYTELLKALEEQGAVLSLQDNDGQSLLHLAAIHGNTAAMQWLLQEGLDADLTDNDGKTALAYAAHMNVVDGVAVLLDHGADVSLPDPDGVTPLHWAALQGNKDVVEMLLLNGAAVNARETNGNESTPFDYAMFAAHEDIAALISEHGGHGILDLKDIAAKRIQRSFRRWRKHKNAGSTGSTGDGGVKAGESVDVHEKKAVAEASSKKSSAGSSDNSKGKGAQAERKGRAVKQKKKKQVTRKPTAQEVAAAVRIQARIRGYKTRKEFAVLKQQAMDKQKRVAQEEQRKAAIAQANAANQAMVRAAQQRRDAVRQERKRLSCVRESMNAATVIQRAFRRWRLQPKKTDTSQSPANTSTRGVGKARAGTQRAQASQRGRQQQRKQGRTPSRTPRENAASTRRKTPQRLSPLKYSAIQRKLRRPKFPNTYTAGRGYLNQDLAALASVDPQLRAALQSRTRRVSGTSTAASTPRRYSQPVGSSSRMVGNGSRTNNSMRHYTSVSEVPLSPTSPVSKRMSAGDAAFLSSKFNTDLQVSLKRQAQSLRLKQSSRNGVRQESNVVTLPAIHSVTL